ncbi:hypothetical protein EVAR_91302_1 [Eumeta japonica]|uniref:Uncharacterized protein n=1 Tax=Eumeta variegata TaxID=151549 RepID=A0A4C1T122_EUMVA|nr:hypothetical protein EVAR_91302_1 [Eumeta japonica]
MIDIQVARELELQGNRETMALQWLNKQSVSKDTERVDLTISGSLPLFLNGVPLEVPRLLSASGPIATTTRLGMVTGRRLVNQPKQKESLFQASTSENTNHQSLLEKMHNMMQSYFEIETLE